MHALLPVGYLHFYLVWRAVQAWCGAAAATIYTEATVFLLPAQQRPQPACCILQLCQSPSRTRTCATN
jgi:hypothetical protein